MVKVERDRHNVSYVPSTCPQELLVEDVTPNESLDMRTRGPMVDLDSRSPEKVDMRGGYVSGLKAETSELICACMPPPRAMNFERYRRPSKGWI